MDEFVNKHLSYDQLKKINSRSLWVYASALGISSPSTIKKTPLIDLIMKVQNGDVVPPPKSKRGAPRKLTMNELSMFSDSEENTRGAVEATGECTGVFASSQGGTGYVHTKEYMFSPLSDVYVTENDVAMNRLSDGDLVKCSTVKYKDGKIAVAEEILEVNGNEPLHERPRDFMSQEIKINAEQINVWSEQVDTKAISAFAPLCKGQRGLVITPRSAGSTTLLYDLSQSIVKNNENAKVIMLLAGAKPEETAIIRKTINCELAVAPFDYNPKNLINVCRLALARAKKLAEYGNDVVLLIDTLSEYYKAIKSLGADESNAVQASLELKRVFSNARNIENGGSITIIGAIVPDANVPESEYGDLIALANWRVYLKTELAEMRIYPAMDFVKSNSKFESEVIDKKTLDGVTLIRRALLRNEQNPEVVIDKLQQSNSIEEFIK